MLQYLHVFIVCYNMYNIVVYTVAWSYVHARCSVQRIDCIAVGINMCNKMIATRSVIFKAAIQVHSHFTYKVLLYATVW